MFTKILMPTDGSPCSFAAARYARDLLKMNPSARLTILHVRRKPTPTYRVYRWIEVEVPLSDEVKKRICEAEELILSRTEKVFADAGLVTDTEVVTGAPAEEISAYAEKGGYDLIVMGSRGAGGVKNVFAGSVSHRVVHLARCPVLIVKG
ncbi:MAG: universal stress protein [Syntrophobacteraceae bacterium]|jgi:nucleotide-binding universal stress UspA family protein